MKKILAKDNYTLEILGEFDNMEAFRRTYPSAEITATESTGDTEIIYC